MSLRMFHLVFIAMSVVLAAFCAAWAIGQYRLEHDMSYLITAIGAAVTGGALTLYGTRFQRRTRQL